MPTGEAFPRVRPVVSLRWPVGGSLLWSLTRLAVLALLVTTLATLLARHHWFADLLANLRVQQFLGLLGTLLLCLVQRRWAFASLVGCCLAIHLPACGAAFPSSSPVPARPGGLPAAKQFSITLVNVMTHNLRHADAIDQVNRHAPDVFVIFELSHTLAARLDHEFAAGYPHSILRPQSGGNFGIGLYSKYPLESFEVFRLNLDIDSISATVMIAEQPYQIFATHPLPPIGRRGYQHRNQHLERLAVKIRDFRIAFPQRPVVLVGDLNLTPWSPHFRDLQTTSGLRRAIDRCDITPTWYRFPLFPFGLVLDHALISDHLRCVEHSVGPEFGSDHRAVTVQLVPVHHSQVGRP